MRLSTWLGLFVVFGVGFALSLLFRGSQQPAPQAPSIVDAAPLAFAHRPKTVPLIVDPRAAPPLAASIEAEGGVALVPPADAALESAWAPATLRRSDAHAPPGKAPQLPGAFPRPLAMLGLGGAGLKVAAPALLGDAPASEFPPPAIAESPLADSPVGEALTHTIADGDTLELLAAQHLGDAALADSIYEANRDVLPARDVLPIGKTIVLRPVADLSDN
ncbi:MAG: hypothetical protein KDA41_00065 [Planctomycetales bacterium]|nr:hypothetical protein [Planctomycetales bacterium]